MTRLSFYQKLLSELEVLQGSVSVLRDAIKREIVSSAKESEVK